MDPAVSEGTPPRRPSTSHDRPNRTPYGPRIRTRTKNSSDLTSLGPTSPDVTSPLSSAIGSPTFVNSFNFPDSPGSQLTTLSIDASLSHPATPQPLTLLTTHTGSKADVAIQVPSTPPPSSIPQEPLSTPAPTHAEKPATITPSKPSVGTFIAPPPLPPPPTVSFEPSTIPWKGLPLEAAQWTFTSAELQEIVSKAIRLSAKESFIRLLSLQALEVDIVKESERLESERLAAQAKWRFEVGRRTMLMQALNSTAAMLGSTGEADGGNPASGLISQLASSIASCDSVLSSILHYADQESQIALVQQRHWSSALGIALRKLNRAYERQAEELKHVQARVQTLEDELEDAWQEAQRMAVEFDDMEEEVGNSEGEGLSEGVDEGEGEEEDEEVVRQDLDDSETINTDLGEVMGVTATAVASKATLLNSSVTPKIDKSDAKSIRSLKSARSKWSVRDGPSYVSRVTAARARSRAASNASLRLPKSLRKSSSPTHTSPTDLPPIPPLPERMDRAQGHSFLDMGNIGNEFVRQLKRSLPTRHPEPKGSLPDPPYTAALPRTNAPSIWLESDSGKTTHLNGLDRTHSLQIFPSLMSRSTRKGRRSNLVMSLSSDPDGGSGSAGSPTSSKEGIPNPSGRPGSAGARLMNNDVTRSPKKSLVSRASSVMLRRLSQATSVTKSLPAYWTKEEHEIDTPPRVGTPNTGEGSVARSCPD